MREFPSYAPLVKSATMSLAKGIKVEFASKSTAVHMKNWARLGQRGGMSRVLSHDRSELGIVSV